MKLIQDSEVFILTTYKYINIYNPYIGTRYRFLDFIPESKRSVIVDETQDKLKKAPLQGNTYGVFRCYKNMQFILSSNLTGIATFIKVE